jgi:YidC/Oxa1 family membrane protein insertase
MGTLWGGLLDFIGASLSFFYDIVPNYGISVILLTIAISLLLFPLTLKQTRSMKAMQEIQPEVKRLQKDLKGDREQLNQELMALYKERGVNPAAGCLPMLVQLPIWFALFRVLRKPADFVPDPSELLNKLNVIPANVADRVTKLVDNPDFLWMNLQASPSEAISEGILAGIPYLVAILIVVATGYYQTRQTMARSEAKGADQTPQQQSMQTVMKVFPLIFGVISWTLPAGLVLYFAVSQAFRIGQQAVILRLDGDHSADAQPKAKPVVAADDGGEVRKAPSRTPKQPGAQRAGSAGSGSRPQARSKKRKRKRRK